MVTPRYRCRACGNLTRFDVVAWRRTQSFHHFTVGGELVVQDEQVLAEAIEQVRCRWCGHGDAIEQDGDAVESSGDRAHQLEETVEQSGNPVKSALE